MNCNNNGVCIDKTETKAAYCDCSGIGYQGSFCETDMNECLINNGGCDSNADCKNIQGGFECECKEGYEGDGIICNPTLTISNEKNENNQTMFIGIGVGAGVLGLCLLILLILIFVKRKVISLYFSTKINK